MVGGLLLGGACGKDASGTRAAGAPASPGDAHAARGSTASGTSAGAKAQVPAQPEALVTPHPQPLPADLPRYAGVDALPEDAYEVQTTVGGRPAAVRLKRDAAVDGVPCAAGGLTLFRNGQRFAGCTLSMDFALEKIPFQKGTEVAFQTDGRLGGFTLPHPQLVLGQPVAAHERVYLTADRAALSSYTLAKDHAFGSVALGAGSQVSFAPNAPGHPLAAVKVKGHATLGGQTYPDGARVYLRPDGSVRMVRGVAKAPAPPRSCPAESTVTVTSKRSAWPQGAPFGPVVAAGLVKHNDHFPVSGNPNVTLYLADYALPSEGLVLSKVDPPPGKAVLELRLQRGPEARDEGVVVGTYQVGPAGDADYYAEARLRMPGRSTLTMDAWHTEGAVELTVVKGDEVCGRFRLEDDHLVLQGTFTVSAAH